MSLNRVNRKFIYVLYKNCVSFLLVQKISKEGDCGPFALAFIAEIFDGKSPMETRFHVKRIRERLINSFKKQPPEVFF